MVRSLMVLALVVAMCPAASELLEVGIHLAQHGDYAHAEDDSHNETSPNEEHGCSELFHLCACHSHVTPLLQQPIMVAWQGQPRLFRAQVAPDSTPGLDDPEPAVRPPIATQA